MRAGRVCRASDGSELPPDELFGWLDAEPRCHVVSAHRGLGRFIDGVEREWVQRLYSEAVEEATSEVFVGVGDDGVEAATMLTDKPMETESFGLPTRAMSHLVSSLDGPQRYAAFDQMLGGVLAAAPTGQLIVLRVDSDDVEALTAAQRHSFHVMESTFTWYGDSLHAPPMPELPAGLEIETFEERIGDALSDQERAALAEKTTAWPLNHFHADPRLPRSAVDRFYGQWVPNITSGTWCDHLLVARYRGEVIGLMCEVSDRTLRRLCGVDVRVGEWIVVTEPGKGAGLGLLATAGRHQPPGVRLHQWETQLRNLPTVRSIEGTGVAIPSRTSYTLHAWT